MQETEIDEVKAPHQVIYMENKQTKLLMFNCFMGAIVLIGWVTILFRESKIPKEKIVVQTEYKFIDRRDCPEEDPLCLFVDRADYTLKEGPTEKKANRTP